MKTLVAAPAAEPASEDLPIVMIVGGTPATRDLWDEACRSENVRRFFIGPKMAARKLREGFRGMIGLVIEPDVEESLAEGDLAELMEAVRESYLGPLWVSDWMHELDPEKKFQTRELLWSLEQWQSRTCADGAKYGLQNLHAIQWIKDWY